MAKTVIRQIQSRIMAIHTPTAPIPKRMPSTYAIATRQHIIDAIAVIMTKRASPAAFRTFGSTNAGVQRKIPIPLWMMMSKIASSFASADIL